MKRAFLIVLVAAAGAVLARLAEKHFFPVQAHASASQTRGSMAPRGSMGPRGSIVPDVGAGFGVPARAEVSARGKIAIRAVPSHLAVTPGQSFHVALDMRIAEGWWYYSHEPGDNRVTPVLPASVEPNVGPLRVVSVLWPAGKRHESRLGDRRLVNNVYQGRATAFVVLQAPEGAKAGPAALSFAMGGQVCDEGHCLALDMPDPYVVTAEVTVGPESQANTAWDSTIAAALERAKAPPAPEAAQVLAEAGLDFSLLAGLGLALLAGVILNVMPCVLPVIPLKVLNLVEHARQSRARMIAHGLAFAAGIMVFFAVLAAASAVLRLATREGISWLQFQSAALRVAVAMIVVAVAANFFGLFNVSLPGFGAAGGGGPGGRPRGGYLSSLGSGVLTAILSTPCSFGYLTTALAWAQLQSVWIGSATIMVVGVGMAGPYVVLTAFPGLLRRLPRPGRWMELLKQSMGFVMVLVAVWLFSTLAEEESDYAWWAAGFAVVLCFGLWMWGSWVRYDAPPRRKWVVRGLAAALVAAAGWWMLAAPQELAVKFADFDRAEIEEARAAGRPVLIDFTAKWCLTCKAVERLVYDDREVADRLAEANVLAVKGDVTRATAPASNMLFRELKEPGVPVSVLYPPGGREPIRLHGIFSKADLLKALKEAAEGRSLN